MASGPAGRGLAVWLLPNPVSWGWGDLGVGLPDTVCPAAPAHPHHPSSCHRPPWVAVRSQGTSEGRDRPPGLTRAVSGPQE